MVELQDGDCAESVRQHVRNHPDIEVTEYVKRGYNGEVYFGTRKKMGDDVVLKFYVADEGYDASEEAVILQRINHPQILKIYHLQFVPPYSAVFLSPKISGGDLAQYMTGNVISSKQALEITADILLGVSELHTQHQLVHRDLKPGNILIDLDSGKPVIADLGSVRKMSEANGYVTTSKATQLYLPPESVIDEQYYFQSDLYQVGLILYQLLGGFFPEENYTDFLTQKEISKLNKITNSSDWNNAFEDLINVKIVKGKLADRDKLPPYLDPKFKRVLNKALHVDYTKRFQNAAEFMKEVHGLQRDFPTYTNHDDHLLIDHKNGLEHKIYWENDGELGLKKRKNGKVWRAQNGHDGALPSILKLIRTA